MNSSKQFSDIWDLDAIFPGGSESPEYAAFLKALEDDIERFGDRIRELETEGARAETFAPLVDAMQSAASRLTEAESFATCLASQNQKDKKAVAHGSAVRSIAAAFESRLTLFDRLLTKLPDDEWEAWMRTDALAPVAFPLTERRRLALDKLEPERESLIGDLAVDGYHGWSELYDTTVGTVEVPYEEADGTVSKLSAGQAQNKLYDPDKAVRDRTFAAWEAAWEDKEDFCALALNRLGGFRLQAYKHRGWDSILKEPLDINRMSAETLESMWGAIRRNRSFLSDYFAKKAELLGVDKLSWTDVDAPIGAAGGKLTFQEGADLIVDQFRAFSPKLADFSAGALRDRWIEAENRPNKRPGGFCTSFPEKKESRIFMTYDGSMNNVSTLAHELGHAFHSHVMFDLPPLAQAYAMNVAETASTFAETIVSDATIRAAADRESKLSLLDDKIQRAVAFLMNIDARFLFETRFYEERKQGVVPAERLSELMAEAQREAYHDALASYHPRFWASKLHFYITEVPFYNFPYTFGYLFSTGLYAVASAEGPAFEAKYVALLRDTGRMTVEALAMKHLGVDLTKPEFWERSVATIRKDVEEFLAL